MRSTLFIILLQMITYMLNAQPEPADERIIAVEANLHTYSVRLKPGQDLKKSIESVVKQERIGAGVILTCVGSLTDVALRLANQEGATTWKGHYEIVSLVGTLSVSGSHIHLSVSDSTGKTIGGHLLDGCIIYTTAELVIGTMPDISYTREPDPTFGYRELVVRKRKKK
jgi:predicted DNA-binding protein with PD1-like motif